MKQCLELYSNSVPTYEISEKIIKNMEDGWQVKCMATFKNYLYVVYEGKEFL